MVGSWSLIPREDSSLNSSPPHFEDDLNSFLLDPFPDFDPVKEWLINLDHAPMQGDETHKGHIPDVSDPKWPKLLFPKEECPDPDESDPTMPGLFIPKGEMGQESLNPDGSAERKIGVEQQKAFLASSIDEKMEKVSLVESSMESEVAEKELGEKNLNPDGSGSGNIELGRQEEIFGSPTDERMASGDRANEACSVSVSVKIEPCASNEECSETETDELKSDDSSSSGSSSSSSTEEEGEDEEAESKGKEKDKVVEVEEGEIRDFDEEEAVLCGYEEEETVPKGPIKSKHEIEVLPPVPQVAVSLEPHHQTLPVGVISSILGNQVIVEGSVKHNPLNEGSILWITETRSQLGLVDEIFGPVKNPYYIIRYNSDNEVPVGIKVGSPIFFVMEFANHILIDKDLYKKGYDASGDNDEEVTDEAEFSDDEKEAEYRRSLRQPKRSTAVNQVNAIVGKKRTSSRKKQPLVQSNAASATSMAHPLPSHIQAPPPGTGNFAFASSSPMVPAVPMAFQVGGFGDQSLQFNAGWGHGFPSQMQQMGMHGGGFPITWLPNQQFGDQAYHLHHQNQGFHSFAGGMIPYQQEQQQQLQQQFVPNVGLPSNMPWLGGPANVGPTGLGGFGQVPQWFGNVNAPTISGLGNEPSHGQPPQVGVGQGVMGSPPVHLSPGRGRSSFRGKRPYQRGRGRSFGGRGGFHQYNG